MKTFQNNGKNITENIIKLKLDHSFNLCCMATGLHMCKGNRFLTIL